MKTEFGCKSAETSFHAVWRYNCTFVEDPTSRKKLMFKGYGAKDFTSGDVVGPLVLMDEEALYLLCQEMLIISDGAVLLSISDMYSKCRQNNPDFPLHYKVYCHFKFLGFSIRSGINYGVHYALYRTFPHMCHAEFCVLVVNNTSFDDCNTPRRVSWQNMSALTRVMPVVLKTLLICHVSDSSISSSISGGDGSIRASIRTAELSQLNTWTVAVSTAMVRRKEMRNKQGTPSSLLEVHHRIHTSCKRKKKRKAEDAKVVNEENNVQKQMKVDSNLAMGNVVFCDSRS